jgi:outer membrane protein TolC
VRSAERLVAAQNAQIGVAESNLYPAFFINGTLGYEAQNLSHLFTSNSFTGQIGPAFQWNILNYGRILNNVRLQDFKTKELIATYQQKVLSAAQEVENGIISFLNSRREAEYLAGSVKAAQRTVQLTTEQWRAGATDLTAEFVAQQFLAQDQIQYPQAQGDIALGLINVYRAIGGGWEFRLAEQCAQPEATPPPGAPVEEEILGQPRPLPPGQ